jgi:hypothetical protein
VVGSGGFSGSDASASGSGSSATIPGGPAYGGGIYTVGGVLTLIDTTFASNAALGGDGGNDGDGGFGGWVQLVFPKRVFGFDGSVGAFFIGSNPDIEGSTEGGETVTIVSAQAVSLLQNVPSGSILLATFAQGSATQNATNYVATVAWGDGQIDSTVSGPSPISIVVQGDQIQVYGIHTYAATGTMAAIVSLTSVDAGGTALATPTITVAASITNQVGVSRSGLIYNRGTKRFGGTLTIANQGTSNLSGSLEVLLSGLNSDATLASGSIMVGPTTYNLTISTIDGVPEIDIPQTLVNDLAPGHSLTISLSFSDPSMGSMSYNTEVFSGTDRSSDS